MTIPINITFLPSWWYRNYGIEFGERYYFDPEYRVRTDMEMQRMLYSQFRKIGLGKKDPTPVPWLRFDHIVPVLFGAKHTFAEDQYVWVHSLNLSEAEIDCLKTPDIENSYPLPELLKQAAYLEEKYGMDKIGFIDTGGVQNNALEIRGEQLFCDYYQRPELARKVLEVSVDTMILLYRFFRKLYARMRDDLIVAGNCTVCMISPKIYHDFLFQYDAQLSKLSTKFAIHHDSIIDKYLVEYRRHKNVVWLDVGWGSNISATRECFPNAHLNLMVSPVFVKEKQPGEISARIEEMISEGKPLEKLSIWIPDVEYGTPDENIVSIFERVDCISEM